MYCIRETRLIPGDTAKRAREYIKTLPKDWLSLIGICKAFYSVTGQLPDTDEAKELGPTIAEILKLEYDYTKAEYLCATNRIIATSRN